MVGVKIRILAQLKFTQNEEISSQTLQLPLGTPREGRRKNEPLYFKKFELDEQASQ